MQSADMVGIDSITTEQISQLFLEAGAQPILSYDRLTGFYRCDAIVDGIAVAGQATTARLAMLHAWSKCFKRVSMGFVLSINKDQGKNPVINFNQDSRIVNNVPLSIKAHAYCVGAAEFIKKQAVWAAAYILAAKDMLQKK